MVEKYIPCILIGIGIGMMIGTFIWSKCIDDMIARHYTSQKELINKFYAELGDQSDRFFKLMDEYIKKGYKHD